MQKSQGQKAEPQRVPDRGSSSQTTGQGQSSEDRQAQPQRNQEQKAKQAEPKSSSDRPQTSGQAQGEQGKQAQPKRENAQGKQPKQDRRESQSNRPTGQGQNGSKQAQPKSDSEQRQQTTGQGQQSNQPTQQSQQNQSQQNSARQDNARVELNAEQRTRISETILTRSDVPRMNQVNFSVRVGTVVPARVRAVAVPQAIIEIRPEFRNHQYVVVRDEIVILDRSRRIVAVIPADSSRTQARRGSSTQVSVDLSPDEIRKVQLVLIERGYSVESDGVLGPRTRNALILFQRREGLQATGSIDTRTVARLGVSIRSGEQPSTTGQGGGTQQPSDRNPAASGQQQQPAASPPSGQQGSGNNQPSAGSGANQGAQSGSSAGSSTTGQGGNAPQSAPSKSNGTGGQGNTASPPAAQPSQSGTAPKGSSDGAASGPSGAR